MFVDLDWPLNASSPLSASAELLVMQYVSVTNRRTNRHRIALRGKNAPISYTTTKLALCKSCICNILIICSTVSWFFLFCFNFAPTLIYHYKLLLSTYCMHYTLHICFTCMLLSLRTWRFYACCTVQQLRSFVII